MDNNQDKPWTLEEAKELAATIRMTCLSMGYFVGLGGDLLAGKPSMDLELIFTPGKPIPLSEALGRDMVRGFVYVNGANPDRLITWLTRLWGPKSSNETDPVATFGTKSQVNNGGKMPAYIGPNSKRSCVYLNKVAGPKAPVKPTTFQVGGGRSITINILNKAD